MEFRKTAGCVAAGVVMVVACGGSDSSASFTIVTPQTAQALGAAFCAKATSCLGDALTKTIYGTVDTCTTRVVAQFQLDVRSLGYGVSDSGGQACAAAIPGLSCADALNGNLPAQCQFTGTLADGATCTADADCASGACFVDDAATCGKCGPRAALGADCTNSECARGLKCGNSKKCTNGALGAACTQDSDCAALSFCRGSVCTAPLEQGAACVVNPTSADVPCDLAKALGCLAAKPGDKMSTCAAIPITYTENGNTCGPVLTGTTFSAVLCDNGDCTNGKCVARPADGTACVVGGPACEQPATCRNNLCALKDPTVCK